MPAKNSPPAAHPRICDSIRKALAERILQQIYKPGERLTELAIAREFGASQAPVREAFRELEASGLVRTERYRGTRVREVSLRESAEAYRVRGSLEQLAAQTALPALDAQLAKLKQCCADMETAARENRPSVQAEHNYEFHRTIVEASGNSVLLRLWESLAFETRTHARLKQRHTSPLADARSHRKIIAAVKKQSAQQLADLLREHSHNFARLIETHLDREA